MVTTINQCAARQQDHEEREEGRNDAEAVATTLSWSCVVQSKVLTRLSEETEWACVWRVQRNLQNGNGHQDKVVKAGLTASGNEEQKDVVNQVTTMPTNGVNMNLADQMHGVSDAGMAWHGSSPLCEEEIFKDHRVNRRQD